MAARRGSLGLLLGAVVLLCGCRQYVDYVPLTAVDEHTGWRYEPHPELLTDDHVQDMKQVLDSYGMKYRMEQGRLQITEELARDQDLLCNLTAKALGLRDHDADRAAGGP